MLVIEDSTEAREDRQRTQDEVDEQFRQERAVSGEPPPEIVLSVVMTTEPVKYLCLSIQSSVEFQ